MTLLEIHGFKVLFYPAQGPPLRSDRDAVDLIGEAFGNRAGLIVIPTERFHPDFFLLKTGIAGGFIQKFVNYRMRLAIVGDISAQLEKSAALRDFVREANRGDRFCFVADVKELEDRLGPV